ncbi:MULTISPECIES: TetR/AcrR family transcriptional regulator [unclassified Nocardiopsis]|uniref:TetR/AcrR family transcriptional regulator n=1 Tax=unclassified Nocardiopsis TaxID=2649073 RepID=UPI00066C026F|nr:MULTISPECIES: TetR/AcrR family transcriptional regulator [unclassified Nocardiopsis]MBQ1081505.1 TetR/AcrR family transcriptional regulator [Nocardiopsis sp. B62]
MTKPPVTSEHRAGGTLSRRERVREATLAEIKEIARRHLVEFGVVGVSLRAIAREMGMTAPGLYRYVPGIDALLVLITAEMYEELADVVSAADASMPVEDTDGRILVSLRAFRNWAITHQAEFSVMFGPRTRLDPEADISRALEAGRRFGSTFFTLFDRLVSEERFPLPADEEIPNALRPELRSFAESVGVTSPDISEGAVMVLTACWVRLYGVVCMEVFQHLSFVVRDMEPFFESELQNMAKDLGVRYSPPQQAGGT